MYMRDAVDLTRTFVLLLTIVLASLRPRQDQGGDRGGRDK
jgi:hypothetical protein